jgi:hypothetical protein
LPPLDGLIDGPFCSWEQGGAGDADNVLDEKLDPGDTIECLLLVALSDKLVVGLPLTGR